jgi:hypothetical protein
MLTLPTDTIISYVDFTKNYFYTMQDKIQSAYWHSYQVTIMVHITCRVDPDFVEGTLDVRIIKESHFWISDDKDHDTLFVQHCFMEHWKWLVDKGVSPKEHWVSSDGCVVQFKSCRPFYFIIRYPSLTRGCQMKWSFFGTTHGKGMTSYSPHLLCFLY